MNPLALTFALAEGALRLAGYAPPSFGNTTRIVNCGWRVLLDCYPTNPRGYFDIDLREPRARALSSARPRAASTPWPGAPPGPWSSVTTRSASATPTFGPRRPGVRRVPSSAIPSRRARG